LRSPRYQDRGDVNHVFAGLEGELPECWYVQAMVECYGERARIVKYA